MNFLLPFMIYSYAAPGFGDVQALLLSSVPPILWSIAEFIRHRRLDALSLLVLAGIVLSLLAFFGGGGPRMLQLREKLVTGVIGIAFLLSAAIRRPLIYELALAGMARSTSGSSEAERMRGMRDDRGFRRSMTIMTVVWGFGLILDVAIGAALVFSLTIKEYMIVNPIEGYALLGGLSLWTFWYSKRARARNEAARAAARNGAIEPSR
ncbi:VC0807 family protein [Sphingomonas sp. UYP23]